MEIFDLAIAYTWEYDKELVELIEKTFQSFGQSTFLIGEFNLEEVCDRIANCSISFKMFFDRASDEDPKFLKVANLLSKRKTYIVNPLRKTVIATDKAKTYRRLRKLKIRTPYSYILPSYNDNPKFKIENTIIQKLGIPFVIKPTTFSGGGQAVFLNAKNEEDIQAARASIPEDKFILQKFVNTPIGKKRLWFRCYWFFGLIVPVWWNDQTHIYSNISKSDYKKYSVYKLVSITKRLSRISGLDYFSTEATMDEKNNFILIDYINDQCDFRLKSKHVDGVPDRIVKMFVKSMSKKLAKLK